MICTDYPGIACIDVFVFNDPVLFIVLGLIAVTLIVKIVMAVLGSSPL